MKKIALLLAILLLPLSASADTSGECGENLTWKYEEATQTLTISGSGAMKNYDYVEYKRAPWHDYHNDIREVIIEEGVTTIGDYAFDFCSALTAVTIPSSVTSIGAVAFEGCTALSSVDIPNSVTNISGFAFATSGLTSVVIPNSVTTIGDGAFDQCKDLTSAIISENVKSLGFLTFDLCPNLTSVTIPEGVTTIGIYAFRGCTGLTSITIPCSVTTIDKQAFDGCSNLTSLTVGSNLSSIAMDAFKDCWKISDIRIVVSDRSTFYKSNTISLIYNYIEGLASFVDTPPVLVGYKLVTLLDVDGNEIKDYVIPDGATMIYDGALSKCGGLNSITIPSSVTSIGSFAFSWCESLTDVYCYASVVPMTYSSGVFSNSNLKNATLHVPASSINDYKSRDPWKGFKNIVPLETETQTAYRPFIEEGKVWTYHYYNDFTGKEFYESLTVSGDTVINNKSYKKIVDVATGRVYCALREEGGKVYANYPNYSGENLIYDFGLNVGDAFPLYEGSDPWATVVSVDTIVVGSRAFRALDVRPNDAKGWPNWWVEGIGGMYHLTSNSIMPGNFYSFSSCQLDGDTLFTSRDFQTLGTVPSPEKVIPMVEEGRTWYCQDIYPGDPHSVDSGYYEHDSAYYVIPRTYVLRGDTVIGENTYKKMYCNEGYCCAMRQNGQKVFSVLDGTEEEQLDYDFGMVKSMSLMRDIITHERLSIENVDTVYVEGIARKRFMIYDDNKMLADIWVEGIGSKEGPMARWRWESTTPEHRMVSCMQGDKLLFSHLDFYPQTDINPVDKIAYRPFIEEDKVWKVGTISGNPVQVVDYYYFDGDTIIDGKTCKQMMCQRYVNPDYSNENWTPTTSLTKVGAWYEENQKVYFYDERTQSMALKYDFSIGDNESLQLIDDEPLYIIGPKQTGGLEGFKGVYRDVMTSQNTKSTTWLESVGGIDGPMRNVYAEAADHVPEFLMSCTVGDEVIYLNDEYEDGATPEGARKDRIDFTHTIKIKPKAPKVKAPRRIEAMSSLYGEYNDQQLGINLNSLDDAYQVSITDEAGKAVYEKTVDAGTIVGLNIDISAYAKGRYTVTVENDNESFTGEFEAQTAGLLEVRSKRSEVIDGIYNLQGQRISTLRKGLNIVRSAEGRLQGKNGRKIYVK